MIKLENVKNIPQRRDYTCGPASLRCLFHYYGVDVSEQELIDEGEIEEDGTSFKQMKYLAHKYDFSFYSKNNATLKDIENWLFKKNPVLVCFQAGPPNGLNGHYSVIVGIDKKYIYLNDPSNYFDGDRHKFINDRKMEIDKFLKHWWDIDDQIVKNWFAVIKPRKERNKK